MTLQPIDLASSTPVDVGPAGDTAVAAGAESATPEAADHAQDIVEQATTLPDFSNLNVDELLVSLAPAAAALAIRTIGVIVLLVIAWIISRWIRRMVRGGLDRAGTEATVRKFLTNLTGWTVIVLALIVSLSIFGVSTTAFAAILGALGLAIGFGFQGALANIAAGVLLLVFKPFRVGDLVEVDGELGIVEEIELYFTRINRYDNTHVILPNDEVLGKKIENLSHNETRRVDVSVGVDYDADPDETRTALEGVISQLETVVEHDGNRAVLVGFGDSSVDWEVRVYCAWADWLTTREQATRAIWHALKDAGIGIPYPHRTLMVSEPLRVQVADHGGQDS